MNDLDRVIGRTLADTLADAGIVPIGAVSPERERAGRLLMTSLLSVGTLRPEYIVARPDQVQAGDHADRDESPYSDLDIAQRVARDSGRTVFVRYRTAWTEAVS